MAELWGEIPLKHPVINIKEDEEPNLTIVMSWKQAKKIKEEYENMCKELDYTPSILEVVEIFTENGIYFPELVHIWDYDG